MDTQRQLKTLHASLNKASGKNENRHLRERLLVGSTDNSLARTMKKDMMLSVGGENASIATANFYPYVFPC